MNSIVHGFDEGSQGGNIDVAVSEPGPGTVCLVYTDTGHGIAPENRSRVFDPFFTTRRGDGCTGLGLHIVFNLVTSRPGGEITLDHGPEGGARFTLAFPRVAP